MGPPKAAGFDQSSYEKRPGWTVRPPRTTGATVSGRTLYQVLMLDPSADTEIITLVYRQLAKRHHPDRDSRSDAGARMAELNAAYATLGDPAKRARYDRSLRRTDSLVGCRPQARRRSEHLGRPGGRGASRSVRPIGRSTVRLDRRRAPATVRPGDHVRAVSRLVAFPGRSSRSRLSRVAPAHALRASLSGRPRCRAQRRKLSRSVVRWPIDVAPNRQIRT